MEVGDSVSTPFGEAKLQMYRETDQVYVLQLSFGTLYASPDMMQSMEEAKQKRQQQQDDENTEQMAKRAMALNEAYEALEQMRRFNLEVACQERGIHPVDYEECTTCLLNGDLAERANSVAGRMSGRMSGLFKSSNTPRLKKFVEEREKNSKPDRCLTCGAPSCAKHSSKEFRREGITVCHECQSVFHMDFIVDCLTLDKEERRKKVDKLIDLYDRSCLLLNFSGQYIDQVTEGLEDTKKRHNKINVGGSSAGIVSGVLGVAAAATILTPAGAPLLIASLVLGSGATAVQTGTDLNSKYFSEPNKIADRILALHGMLLSVLTVTGTLRDAATRDHIRTDAFEEDSPVLVELRKNHIENRKTLMAGMTAGRFSLASAELIGLTEGATLARSARLFGRSGTAAMRTLRFARVAGGALAAATLLVEAKCMHSAVSAIQAGSPCEKADALRAIQADMPDLPRTASLDRECGAYLSYMDQRGRRMKEDEAVQLLLEVSKAEQEEAERQAAEEAARAEQEGDLIVEGEEAAATESMSVASSSNASSSLLERIQQHKENERPPEDGRESKRGSSDNSAAASDNFVDEEEGEWSAVPKHVQQQDSIDDDEWSQVTTSTNMSASASLLDRIEQFKKKESV